MIYCGEYDHVPDEYNRLGTRKECLQKGIGVGLYMTTKEREKIKKTIASREGHPKPKIYCGDKEPMPVGYLRNGNRMECLRRGVGIGVHLPAPAVTIMDENIHKIADILNIRVGNKTRFDLLTEIIDKLNLISSV
jgi:hypothetical protein